MAMAIAHLIIMIPFLIFAIILSRGKGGFLFAGYNNLPESEKEQYDEVALCKFMGKMMYGICLSFLLFALSSLFEMKILFNVGLTLLIAIVIFGTWYVPTLTVKRTKTPRKQRYNRVFEEFFIFLFVDMHLFFCLFDHKPEYPLNEVLIKYQKRHHRLYFL